MVADPAEADPDPCSFLLNFLYEKKTCPDPIIEQIRIRPSKETEFGSDSLKTESLKTQPGSGSGLKISHQTFFIQYKNQYKGCAVNKFHVFSIFSHEILCIEE